MTVKLSVVTPVPVMDDVPTKKPAAFIVEMPTIILDAVIDDSPTKKPAGFMVEAPTEICVAVIDDAPTKKPERVCVAPPTANFPDGLIVMFVSTPPSPERVWPWSGRSPG